MYLFLILSAVYTVYTQSKPAQLSHIYSYIHTTQIDPTALHGPSADLHTEPDNDNLGLFLRRSAFASVFIPRKGEGGWGHSLTVVERT